MRMVFDNKIESAEGIMLFDGLFVRHIALICLEVFGRIMRGELIAAD